jgi:hypothetical protein
VFNQVSLESAVVIRKGRPNGLLFRFFNRSPANPT